MMKLKLVLQYDGTPFAGWQRQSHGLTIQGICEEKLSTILREKVTLVGASRTDAGVHARGQVAHCTVDAACDLPRLLYSFNALLPPEIRALSIEEVPETFHAQISCVKKEYHYYLHLHKERDPFGRLYHWHLKERLDLPLIKEGCKLFVGSHDFASFANLGSHPTSTTRHIYHLDFVESETKFVVVGNGFLYKLVRNIVGALIEVGRHRLSIEELQLIMEKRDRRQAPAPAPPQGLFLVHVSY